ncbi:hypothetical protein KC950_03235 [Candidatus Saccharibacteria bacterium]|nr:hypothetical protein [Candidatus Saccharibacteria bacterium]
MPPNNQTPQAPNPPSGNFDSSQFDFIMNNGQNQKKSLIPLPADPKKKLIVIVVGGAILLVLLLVLFFSIFGGNSGPVENLVPVVKQQNEIVRISDKASNKLSSGQARKLSAMIISIIATDRKKTADYMAQNGRKVDNKELVLGSSAEVDKELADSQQNGRLDEVYTQITLEYLQKYQQNLESVYTQLGDNGKELLKQNNDNVQLILQDNSSL